MESDEEKTQNNDFNNDFEGQDLSTFEKIITNVSKESKEPPIGDKSGIVKTFEKIENIEQLKMIILNLNEYNLLDNIM